MILLGTLVNAAAIVAGSIIGLVIPKLEERYQRTVTQGIGLALCALGLMMAFRTDHFIMMVISLALGGVLGEWADIERRFEQVGGWLECMFRNRASRGDTGKAFVTASLVFCIGAMAILGSIDSGMRNNHEILYTKSLMDGIMSIIFASALGFGVVFSAVAVFIYQGAIAAGAALVASYVSESAIQTVTVETSAVGGVLILGIALNMLEIKKVSVANLLPSVVVMAVLAGGAAVLG